MSDAVTTSPRASAGPARVAASSPAPTLAAVRRVTVVIPARDEAELLPSCLRALSRASARLRTARLRGLQTRVVVVADRCTDATEALALAGGAQVVRSRHGRVGAARHQGVLHALAGAAADGIAPEQTWICSTDADTLVPPTWLARQVALADSGYDALIGTVEPTHLPPDLLRAWQARHTLTEDHTHVHGANLSFRGSAYLSVGGFDAVDLHEDVGFVQRLQRSSLRWRATDTLRVATSGRLSSRVEAGFAGYLTQLAGEVGA